ncbi:MAG: c-type cytochrome [Proteobacteria bacterium]|nr:c-type cytochrome [Pseudomonadota bacterium]
MYSATKKVSAIESGGRDRAMFKRDTLLGEAAPVRGHHAPGLVMLIATLGASVPSIAQPDAVSRTVEIYAQRCSGCHGQEGDGLGPAAERLNPPPRDFTLGMYKIKSSGFDEYLPNDEDLLRMIRDGMPGTAMPAWGDVLSDQEMADLVRHIKTLAGYEADEKPSQQVEYGTQVLGSADSIRIGRELFLERDRCSECHGKDGKGDGLKSLKDDNGERTWPRNLTKPWTFRASNDPRDIYTRISAGIAGTQMPSFADPASDKVLSSEERWHVANYVSSLAKTDNVVRPDNTVVKAAKLVGRLPDSADDPAWEQAEPSTFFLVPQMLAKKRLFKPTNDTISVSALYNEQEIAFLLEWDDRTQSIPGDENAEKIADGQIFEDSVALQLPLDIPSGTEKPYFGMGDPTHAVNIWQWTSGTTDEPEQTSLINARGIKDIERRDAAGAGVQATGTYQDGTWRVVINRALATANPRQDIQFLEGRFIPLALAAWDGSNGETQSRHTMTSWYWLLLKSPAGSRPLIVALIVILAIIGAEFWWMRSASRRRRQ